MLGLGKGRRKMGSRRTRDWFADNKRKGDMPVAYQRQVLQPGNLVLLPCNAEQGTRDLVILGDGRVGDGLRERLVRVGVGRLDERPHKGLGRPRRLGARRARRDVHRVDDAFEPLYIVTQSLAFDSYTQFPILYVDVLALRTGGDGCACLRYACVSARVEFRVG